MSALDLIKQKISRNEHITKIELAIFNNCQSIPFPKTAEAAAEELAQKNARIAELEAKKENDLNFLKELRQHVEIGSRDTTQHEIALKMIDNWIDELEGEDDEKS